MPNEMSNDHSSRKFGPLLANNPIVTSPNNVCPGCGKRFAAGQFLTLITIGPGDQEEERAKARAKRAYNAIAIPAHWACVTGEA